MTTEARRDSLRANDVTAGGDRRRPAGGPDRSPDLLDYEAPGVAENYHRARELSAETMRVWRDTVRVSVPAAAIRRVVDLGAGTGRFTGMLADLFGARVIALDASLAMLGRRDVAGGRGTRVAATGEALPLRAAAVDLVFMSMVYHAFRSAETAVAELRRAVRPHGYVVLRNGTRDTLDDLLFLRFFPESRALDARRMPARATLVATFRRHGFASRGHRTVWQKFAATPADYLDRISRRGLSSLQLIPDDAFAAGLRGLEAHCRAARPDEPVYEPVDLFVFERGA
jgi:SAM-dependent methyltransferase